MRKIIYILLLIPSLLFGQGSEKITNGDFASATGWGYGTGVSISGGVASFDGASFRWLAQADSDLVSPMQTSTEYTLSFDISNSSTLPYIQVYSDDYETYIATTSYTEGSHSVVFTTPSNIGTGGIRFRTSEAFDIDNISLIQNADIGDSPYYVAVDGDNAASGDINNPWATFQRAINVAGPGDTVYFRGGVYYMDDGGIEIDAWNGIGNNGTVDNYIHYLNYLDEEPIFDFRNYIHSGSTQWSALGINFTTYLYFKGFTIRHVNQGAAEDSISAFGVDCGGASNLTFENLTIHNVGGRAFGFFGGFGGYNADSIGTGDVSEMLPDVPADTVKWINCDAYNNCDSIDVGSFVGGLADGFKANNTSGAYLYFYGCRAWNNSDDGFDPNGGATVHIENCWTFNNGQFDGDGYGIKTIGLSNFYYDQPGATPVIRKFYNNIAANNSYLGISLGMRDNWYLPSSEFYNNVVYNNPTGFVQSAEYDGVANPVIYKNNLAYDNLTNVSNAGTFTGSHNSFEMGFPWEDSLTITSADFTVALDSATIVQQLTASRKSDNTLPDITVFKLAEDSWMKSEGTDVGMSTTPDIGIDWDYYNATYATQPTQIIADHTVVDLYDDIPQNWIDSVKTMWLNYVGRSHSLAIGNGLADLEAIDGTYPVIFKDIGTLSAPTTTNLRVDRATWGNYDYADDWRRWSSEGHWWTNATGIQRIKNHLTYTNTIGNPVSVMAYAHSYELYASAASATADPVTGNRWYGWSEGSSTGSGPWGLDDADNTITGNAVNLDDYLAATEEFIAYCADSIPTTVIFTTGPVERDGIPAATDEAMYSGYLKNEHIRNYVLADETRILFDYADILCYNNAGQLQTLTWDGNIFPTIHDDNFTGAITAHIGEEGLIRLAKAMWYMLARIAGWEGVQSTPPVDPPVPPQAAIYRHLGSGGSYYPFNGKYLK